MTIPVLAKKANSGEAAGAEFVVVKPQRAGRAGR